MPERQGQGSDATIVRDIRAALLRFCVLLQQSLQLSEVVFTDGGVESIRVFLRHRAMAATAIIAGTPIKIPSLTCIGPRVSSRDI